LKYAKDIREGIKFAFSPELAQLVMKGWTVAESLVELDLDLDVKDSNETAAHINLAEFKDLYKKVSGTDEKYAGKPTKGWHYIINTIHEALPEDESKYVIAVLRFMEHVILHEANIALHFKNAQEVDTSRAHQKNIASCRTRLIEKNKL